MKISVAMTVTNRPQYLGPVLESWSAVRGIDQIQMHFACEPTITREENMALIRKYDQWSTAKIWANPRQYGISLNPYSAINHGFGDDSDYVILAEDDLLVSDDILEYHHWAAEQYKDDDEIAAVCSFTHDELDPAAVQRSDGFCPWIWGTWHDRWEQYVGAEWDLDLIHHLPGHPNLERGWDWHLNKRVLPKWSKQTVHPMCSRSNSIGIYGYHSNPAMHVRAENFQLHREPVNFYEDGC